MSTPERRILAQGLGYLEGARWHDGALWFSDMKHLRVHRLTDDGELTTVAEVPTRPSGLGFEPDGSLLIVSMGDERLLRLRPGDREPTAIADLGEVGLHPNDMTVDRAGRAYISQFGFRWFEGEELRPTGLIVRHPDGRLEACGGGLEFPNGLAVSGDGRTLFVSESFGSPRTRLTAFQIDEDGTLGASRVVHEFGPTATHVVDGICIDEEDGVWVALCQQGEFLRVLPDGTVTDTIAIPPEGGNYAVASALGGPEGRTLYLLVADADVERINAGFLTTARVEAVEVAVPAPAR